MLHDWTSENGLIHRVNVGDLLGRSAARYPNKEFVCDGERRWSYRDFDAWTNRVAHGLSSLGLKPGEALALMSGNRAEFLAVYFACARLGLVCVPINLLWKQAEISHVLTHSQARAVVVEGALLDDLFAALTRPQDIAAVVVIDSPTRGRDVAAPSGLPPILRFNELIDKRPSTLPEVSIGDRAPLSFLYTSGTTSAPKGVVGTHLAIYLESLGTAIDTRMTERDRLTVVLPLFHTAQLNALCTPAIAVGASLVIQRAFDPRALHEIVERERVTLIFALPMMVQKLVDEQAGRPRDLGRLRLVVYAMAPMPEADLRRAIEVLGCDFSLLFGQTEMSPVATVFRPEHQLSHPGAVGTPSINVEVGIMVADGTLVPAGMSGEIVYRSPQAMAGYLRNPEATEEVFRHRWFHSGDAGHFDQDGLLWFEDRFKDVIKTGGENVSSLEVELAVRAADPLVAEVAVIGLPHPHWGEAITAIVVPKEGTTINEASLRASVRERLSAFKCPKAVIALPELPKTATGKVQKAQLRRIYAQFYG